MKSKSNSKTVVIAIVTLSVASVLSIMPTFRAAAQTKDKPATSTKKSESKTTSRQSAANGSSSKVVDINDTDISQAIEEVKNAMTEIEKMDLPKVKEDIKKAFQEIHSENIQRQINSALKEVEQVNKTAIQNAMQAIDAKKINAEVRSALAEIDLRKIEAEVASSFKQIDWATIEKELAKAKDVKIDINESQMAELKNTLAEMSSTVADQLKATSSQLRQTLEDLSLVRDGIEHLKKDGIIKKGDKVSIEFKNDILYLNSVPQSKEVSEKYKKYFQNTTKPHSKMTVNNSNEIK